MSLRNNKATRLNRYMMFGMFFIGIVVIGCVFAFLYLSFNKENNPFVKQSDEDGTVDSVIVIVDNPALLDSL